jgi:hypothetical protein
MFTVKDKFCSSLLASRAAAKLGKGSMMRNIRNPEGRSIESFDAVKLDEA